MVAPLSPPVLLPCTAIEIAIAVPFGRAAASLITAPIVALGALCLPTALLIGADGAIRSLLRLNLLTLTLIGADGSSLLLPALHLLLLTLIGADSPVLSLPLRLDLLTLIGTDGSSLLPPTLNLLLLTLIAAGLLPLRLGLLPLTLIGAGIAILRLALTAAGLGFLAPLRAAFLVWRGILAATLILVLSVILCEPLATLHGLRAQTWNWRG